MENLDLLLDQINQLPIEDKIERINEIKIKLHEISPFKNEPVDCVIWEKNTNVVANDYNPNKVAPPEMELLEISIMNDWYTQPIVTWNTGENKQIIDWFHRHRVGMESKIVSSRILWYLPIVDIRKEQTDKNDRIASTIRHNRARGKHQIDAMSEIVIELKNRNWKNERIARELGMDQDEVLRLLQITWLQELFKDDDFSRAWNTDWSIDDYEDITDQIDNDTVWIYRATNTDDPDRIFHTFDERECYKAWLYATTVEWMSEDECKQKYYDVLSDSNLFWEILEKIIVERKNSCEHYLTNKAMNRLAWLWQAAVCYHTWVPQKFCWWRQLLSEEQKENANNTALIYLNKRMVNNNRPELDMKDAISEWRQVDIY